MNEGLHTNDEGAAAAAPFASSQNQSGGIGSALKNLFQPPGGSLCGQTCVAMLVGVTLELSSVAFGGTGWTKDEGGCVITRKARHQLRRYLSASEG